MSEKITFPAEITVVKDKLLSADFRNYLYDISLTLIPILIIWGKITHDQAQYILNVVAAILGLGTVTVTKLNKPRKMIISTDTAGDVGTLQTVKEVKDNG